MLNEVFHQEGEHVNLFDYELLEWLFEQAGFIDCERTDEPAFLRRFPGFPPRNDDKSSIYLRAKSPPLVAN